MFKTLGVYDACFDFGLEALNPTPKDEIRSLKA